MPPSASRPASTVNPNWPQYACSLTILIAVLAAAIRHLTIDWHDRDHCKALVRTGRWMTDDFKSWQPEGCMTHAYAPALIRTCLGRRRLVFLGDSNTRDLFFAMCQAADPATAPAKPDDGKKHTDLSWSSSGGGPDFHFFWDPYLNSSHLSTILANPYPLLPLPASTTTMTTALAGGGGEAALAPSLPAHPALLVLGSGLWYLREPSSGGIASWEARIDAVFGQIAKASSAAAGGGGGGRGSSGSGQAAAAGSKDRWRGAGGGILADQVVVLPVPSVVPAKLSAERRATLLPSEIDAMNADLLARLTAPTTGSSSSSSAVSALFAGGGGGDGRVSGSTTDDEATTTTTTKPKVPPVHFPSSFNDLLDPSQTADGLHYSPKLGRVQAQLLYNLRCNDVLPKGFPMDKTCCRRYPGLETAVQALVLGLVGLWAPVGKLNERRLAAYPRLARLFPTEDRSVLAGTVFGLCVGLTYLSDRTGLWLKENKSYDGLSFAAGCLALVVGALATMRRSEGGKDLGFLNREQTDEWKGWMQVVILIYHYLGASKVSGIYNPIRVLVAGYLFMTGYGHFTFYYKKADYGIDRIAMVMVRLNLLPVVLAYAMGTDYLSYYFSPLVSFWYLIIYATMRIGASYNSSPAFLIPKLVLSATAVTTFMWTPWLLEAVFAFLGLVANVHWSPTEWAFRVNLDLFVVWLGMATAYGYLRAQEVGLADRPWFAQAVKASVGLALAGLGWFFWFELGQPTKFTYNKVHPVVSFVPVLSFVVLRNSHRFLRSVNSRLCIFIGQISLETFILQFHLWLGADTKGILLVLPGTKWRPLNVVVSTVIFLFVSHKAAQATAELTTLLVGKRRRKPPPTTTTTLPLPVSAPAAAAGESDASKAREEEEEGEAIPLLESPLTTGAPKPANDASAAAAADAAAADEALLAGSGGRRPSAWPEWMRRTSFAAVVRPSAAAPAAAAAPSSSSSSSWLVDASDNNGLKLGGMLLVCWILNLLSPWP